MNSMIGGFGSFGDSVGGMFGGPKQQSTPREDPTTAGGECVLKLTVKCLSWAMLWHTFTCSETWNCFPVKSWCAFTWIDTYIYVHINLFIRGGRCSVTISETKKTGLRRVGVDRKGVQDCRHRRLECACPWQLRYTYIEMGARRRSASRRPTPPHDRRNMFYKSSFTFSHTSNRGIGACFWHKSLFLFLSSENKSPK